MIQRLAIAAGGIAAAVVLTVGLVAAGFDPLSATRARSEAGGPEVAAADPDAVTAASPEPSLEPRVVYVKPAPKAKTVVVKKPARRTAARTATITKRSKQGRSIRYERDDDRDEQREHARERAEERRKHEREQAQERRKHEREEGRERDDD